MDVKGCESLRVLNRCHGLCSATAARCDSMRRRSQMNLESYGSRYQTDTGYPGTATCPGER
eukprot:3260292-Rhodomonas_salina.7